MVGFVISPTVHRHPGVSSRRVGKRKELGVKVVRRDRMLSLPLFSGVRMNAKDGGEGERVNLIEAPRRKIAIIVEPTPFTHVSGYSNRFKTHIDHLKEAGDDVLVICPDNSPDAPTEYNGARIHNVPGFRFPLYNKIQVSLGIRGVYSALKDFDPDVIHLSTPGFMTFAILVYARLLRKPLLFSYHTHLPRYAQSYGMWYSVGLSWWLIKVCHNRADATLATSPQLCGELRQQGVERVGLWPKGVDTKTFNPKFRSAAMRSKLTDGNPEENLIVYVGRMGAEKNLQSVKAMLEKLPSNVRLALVGDGPYRETLERQLEGTKTYFAGQMSGEELSSAFASADAFIMPSESETLGFVVMESMASGVPVVGARAGGIPDLIQHKKNGFLYEPGNVDEAVKYLRTLLFDAPIRSRMGNAARDESERWSWKAATAVTRNVHYVRAITSFRFRALWGFGLPRSLSWLRWMRRRFVMVWVLLFHQMRAVMQY